MQLQVALSERVPYNNVMVAAPIFLTQASTSRILTSAYLVSKTSSGEEIFRSKVMEEHHQWLTKNDLLIQIE